MGVSSFISRVEKKKWYNFKTAKHNSKLGYTAKVLPTPKLHQAQVIIEELIKGFMVQTDRSVLSYVYA
jgi:hypothetical protein